MPKARTIICAECNAAIMTCAPVQKYCAECSAVKAQARKNRWARENPPPQEIYAHRRRKRRSSEKEAGIRNSALQDRSVNWIAECDPDLLWLVRVSVPFSYAASKNHIYSLAGTHVALRKESRSIRDVISYSIKAALKNIKPVVGKVWVDIMVEKPNHKGDAVNVVDLVCDAVKTAIGVDDRWFSIRRLDWRIVKSDPQLIIGVGQESDIPMQPCSRCGRIFDLSKFSKKRGAKNGVGRACRDCRTKSGSVLECTVDIEPFEAR